MFHRELGVSVSFRHRYACEKDPKKRDHIMKNAEVDMLLTDMYPCCVLIGRARTTALEFQGACLLMLDF